jgi:hypothetical protein
MEKGRDSKESRENYRKLLEVRSFWPLHQTRIKRDMNFAMGDFLELVSHVPTPWDNSVFVAFVLHTALLYVI